MTQIAFDIARYMGELKRKSPEEIISDIRIELSDFIENTVTKEDSRAILIVERKARHLFQPFVGRLMEKGCSLSFLRILRRTVWIKGSRPERIGLLTDCINTGEEVKTVKEHLQAGGHDVNKIYSYASKQSALANLRKENIIEEDQVISAHELSDEMFGDFFKRLQIYYQSRIEPMDIDHSYDLYRVSTDSPPSTSERIIESSCRKVLGNDSLCFERDENLHLPKNMISASMSLETLSTIENGLLKKQIAPLIREVEFEFPQLRVKARFQTGEFQFSIFGCFPPLNVELSPLKTARGRKECTIGKRAGCYFKVIRSEVQIPNLLPTVCPLCIENYAARAILDRIGEVFSLMVGRDNVSVQKFNPIDRPS